MTNFFIIVLVLAIYKTGVLAMHHIEDDNVFAFIGDVFTIIVFIITAGIMYYFF